MAIGRTMTVGAPWKHILVFSLPVFFGLVLQQLYNTVDTIYVPVFGVFQGANHCGLPTVVATVALSTRVIITYLFKDSQYFGCSIIWWNGLFGFSLALCITWYFYLSGKWQKDAVINR